MKHGIDERHFSSLRRIDRDRQQGAENMTRELQEKLESYQRVWAEVDLDAIWENMVHMKENMRFCHVKSCYFR